MGYSVTLCTTNKRRNSTAQVGGGQTVTASLKNGCSLLYPVFQIRTTDDDFNYVKFKGRGYWVKDKVWTREDLLTVVCSVDVLGSWKSNIVNSSAYVTHSASVYNAQLQDSRLMVESQSKMSAWTGDPLTIFDYDNGKYITGVIGKPNKRSPSGMTCVYALDYGTASDLAVAFNEGSVIEQVTQQFGSAFNALIFCRWVPLRVGLGDSATISLADYNTGITGNFLSNRYVSNLFQVPIPWYSSDFRRVEPYSFGYLFLPYVGVVSLELSNITEMETLLVSAIADCYTGDIVYKVGGGTRPLAVYTGNCAVEIPINSYQRDWKGVVQNGVSTLINIAGTALQAGMAAAGAAAAGGAGGTGGMGTAEKAAMAGGSSAMGGAGGIMGGIASTAMSYFTFNTGSKGGFSGGCGSGLGLAPQCVVVTHETSQNPESMRTVLGRPCGRTLNIGGLSGFVQTSGFRVSGPMTDDEKSLIDAMMDGGVYIE